MFRSSESFIHLRGAWSTVSETEVLLDGKPLASIQSFTACFSAVVGCGLPFGGIGFVVEDKRIQRGDLAAFPESNTPVDFMFSTLLASNFS
jgi:hypothetical protein